MKLLLLEFGDENLVEGLVHSEHVLASLALLGENEQVYIVL